jgi:hypothetical protein
MFVSAAAVTAAGPMAVTGLSLAAWPAPHGPRLIAATLPAASAGGQGPGSGSAAGAVVLVAVAVASVGAFAVLQVMARPGRRRAPVSRGRRARAARYDWRTLPPQYEEDAGRAEVPVTDHDGYGPLWRYGSPHGYARDYGPGHSPDHGPGYAPRARPPWSAPQDAAHEPKS